MRKKIAEEWAKALRSEKYKQGKVYLKYRYNQEFSYCALGVLCEIVTEHEKIKIKMVEADNVICFDGCSTLLPLSIIHYCKLKTPLHNIAHMNDHNDSFEQISNYVLKNWRML